MNKRPNEKKKKERKKERKIWEKERKKEIEKRGKILYSVRFSAFLPDKKLENILGRIRRQTKSNGDMPGFVVFPCS
jgi:hypothetical protein